MRWRKRPSLSQARHPFALTHLAKGKTSRGILAPGPKLPLQLLLRAHTASQTRPLCSSGMHTRFCTPKRLLTRPPPKLTFAREKRKGGKTSPAPPHSWLWPSGLDFLGDDAPHHSVHAAKVSAQPNHKQKKVRDWPADTSPATPPVKSPGNLGLGAISRKKRKQTAPLQHCKSFKSKRISPRGALFNFGPSAPSERM